MAIQYTFPQHWILYDRLAIADELVGAKAAVQALTQTPYQRGWVERLQQIQLKMEVAGTSRIEGADFTENELDAALDPASDPRDLITRSQQQARAAVETYRWISALPTDRPIDEGLVKEIHRRIVTGCDDDHCPPGVLRGFDQNVVFGSPRHRGCEGGAACGEAFGGLIRAVRGAFQECDALVQALALHYHLGAMHPFLDGNGRTARALEALMLQRAGLRDTAFIAMSNYYYEEKPAYLAALAESRRRGHDLTPFLKFGLRGIEQQCNRLFADIRKNMRKALFRETMYDLFNRLASPRKRALKERQIQILKVLLDRETIATAELRDEVWDHYKALAAPGKALVSDLARLWELGAVALSDAEDNRPTISIRLEWPEEITESEFYERTRRLPKGRSFKFLR